MRPVSCCLLGGVLILGCGGGTDGAADAPPALQLPEGTWPIDEMRVGSAGCGDSSFDLTLQVTSLGGGSYELVHDGSAVCGGMTVACQAERIEVRVDGTGLVVDSAPVDGSCVTSTDFAGTPRPVERRSFGISMGSFTENITLEGSDPPRSATFVFL